MSAILMDCTLRDGANVVGKGFSAANAIAAYENGVSILDCGLMGMARSAGNLTTELCVAIMQRLGQIQEINLYGIMISLASVYSPP